MGYNVYVTRAENWSDGNSAPIAPEEWLAAVAAGPGLRLEPDSGDYFAVWEGADAPPGGGWFDWSEGNVFTSSPDRPIVAKMLELAALLGAKVQGEDGKVYASPADWPDD